MKTGCRIPHEFFVTTGAGQSNAQAGNDHWETSAYDIALEDAGVENFNIVKYTSVLPPEAKQVSFREAKHRFHHGSVLECIMAQTNGEQGQHLCAGVAWLKVYNKGTLIGGFACEYEGYSSVDKAKEVLKKDLMGLIERRYHGDPDITWDEPEYAVQDLVVDEAWGTVLAGICFISYIIPEERG